MQILETGRLVLRQMTRDDIPDLLRIFDDPEAMRHYPRTYTRQDAEEWVARNQARYARHGLGLWIAEDRLTGAFVGQCGLAPQQVAGRDEVEIGYLFLRASWGQGYATEAARACRDYGFATLGYHRLISLIDPSNRASRRVAEKVGLALEREVEQWGKTLCLYAIEREHADAG